MAPLTRDLSSQEMWITEGQKEKRKYKWTDCVYSSFQLK